MTTTRTRPIVAALIAALLMTACGGGDDTSTTNQDANNTADQASSPDTAPQDDPQPARQPADGPADDLAIDWDSFTPAAPQAEPYDIADAELMMYDAPFTAVADTAGIAWSESFTIIFDGTMVRNVFVSTPAPSVTSPDGSWFINTHRHGPDGEPQPLPDSAMYRSHFPMAIDNNGTAVGATGNIGEGGNYTPLSAVAWSPGVVSQFNPFSLPDDAHTMLFDVSANGTVRVGMIYLPSENRMMPMVARDGEAMTELPLPPDATGGIARCVSPDGNVIAGEVYMPRVGQRLSLWYNALNASHAGVPCVWIDSRYHLIDTSRFPRTDNTGEPTRPGSDPFAAIDRRVGIVQTVTDTATVGGYLGDQYHPRSAFIWDPNNGLRLISELIEQYNVYEDEPPNNLYSAVLGITPNGQAIFGTVQPNFMEPQGFLLLLPTE